MFLCTLIHHSYLFLEIADSFTNKLYLSNKVHLSTEGIIVINVLFRTINSCDAKDDEIQLKNSAQQEHHVSSKDKQHVTFKNFRMLCGC